MRYGYRMGEQFSSHTRRRFRLVPGPGAVQNAPQVDPNLWIVQYAPAEKNERVPVNRFPILPQTQQMLAARQQLYQMGQIVRKEFMLSDRVNWPRIPFPTRGQTMYPAPMPPRHIPQNIAYPPHGGPPIATSKRRGGHAQNQAHAAQMMPGQLQGLGDAFDDEEDISRGDLFDHLTPREVSIARYQQNHEWMEEILSSPYRIGQIEVSDLGLGRKGELASLTDGIFEAQGSEALTEGPKKPYTGHLDPELAEQFRKRVAERNDAVRAEIEQMKAQHAKTLEQFRGNAAIMHAEKELRVTVEETGPEPWRLEGRVDDSEEGSGKWAQKQTKKIEDILARVEQLVGKRAAVVHDVHRAQDGGYQEPAPEPEPVPQPELIPGPGQVGLGMSRQPSHAGSTNSGVMIGDSDIDMGGTAAGLLDQMHTGFSSTSTPQPHLSAIQSSAATPANLNAPSPQPTLPPTAQGPGDDVNMEDAGAPKPPAGAGDPSAISANDWVVVPKGGISPGSNPADSAPAASTPGATAAAAQVVNTGSAPQQQQQPPQQPPAAGGPSSKPASAAPTPGLGFDGDNNDFSSLGDLDTAGDALANYDPPSVGVDDAGGLGDDMGMEMEDSAFGDAFHGVEQSGGGADTPSNNGM